MSEKCPIVLTHIKQTYTKYAHKNCCKFNGNEDPTKLFDLEREHHYFGQF